MDREQFLAERRTGIGASDSPVLVLGEHFGKTPLDLWAEKCGLVPAENLDDNPHVRRGMALEDIAAAEFTRTTGLKTRRVNEQLRHAEHSYLTAHLDRVIVGDGRPLEIKCPSSWAYKRLRRTGVDQGYQVQGQHESLLWKNLGTVFFVFCADLWEGTVVEVAPDPTVQEAIIELGRDFWMAVENGEPPALAPAIELPPPEGVTPDKIITRDDPEWCRAVAKLREAKAIKEEALAYEAECMATVKAIAGGPGQWIKTPDGARVDWSVVAGRRTFDHKALAKARPDLDLEPYFKTGKPGERFQLRLPKED